MAYTTACTTVQAVIPADIYNFTFPGRGGGEWYAGVPSTFDVGRGTIGGKIGPSTKTALTPVMWSETVGHGTRPVWDKKNRSWSVGLKLGLAVLQVLQHGLKLVKSNWTLSYDWTIKWQLNISIPKCVVLRLGNRNVSFTYNFNNQALPNVSVVRDLGVLIDCDLKLSSHIEARLLRLISELHWYWGVLSAGILSCYTELRAFVTYVRHILEYNNNNNNNTSISKAHNVSIRAESEAPII